MKILLAFALVAVGIATAAPASAQDQRPCVSKVEYRGVDGAGVVPTRDFLEDRWEVANHALHMPQYDTRGFYVLAYKACGYNIREAQVLVRYRLSDDVATAAQRYVRPKATSHGHV